MPRDDLSAYIAAVRHIAGEWEMGVLCGGIGTLRTIQIELCARELLAWGCDLYLLPHREHVDDLIQLCTDRCKLAFGSSIPCADIFAAWFDRCGYDQVPLTAAERMMYSAVAAVSISLSCDVHQENGVWVVGNAEWC